MLIKCHIYLSFWQIQRAVFCVFHALVLVEMVRNSTSPSCLEPLYQSEDWCTTVHMQISLVCMWMKSHLQMDTNPRLEKEAYGNLEMASYHTVLLFTVWNVLDMNKIAYRSDSTFSHVVIHYFFLFLTCVLRKQATGYSGRSDYADDMSRSVHSFGGILPTSR